MFPGVIIFPDAGAGSALWYPPTSPYTQIAEYFSERGFVVLDRIREVSSQTSRYRSNAWGNLTFNNLKQDAETALSVLLEQPEVNATKKATLIGHSEGTKHTPKSCRR